jgi:hypothetical protein
MYNEIYVIILHQLHEGGARGRGFIVIGVLRVQPCQLPHEVIFLLGCHLFVSLLDVLLLLGLRELQCWTSILGTTTPDSSKPAVAMALLMRWPTNDDDEQEDKLNYAPLPHLSSFLSSSPSSLPRLSFSFPALSALPAMVAGVVSSFPRGSPSPASPRAAARAL